MARTTLANLIRKKRKEIDKIFAGSSHDNLVWSILAKEVEQVRNSTSSGNNLAIGLGGIYISYQLYDFHLLTCPGKPSYFYVSVPLFICGERRTRYAGLQCRLPPNHGGRHRAGSYSWDSGMRQLALFPGYHHNIPLSYGSWYEVHPFLFPADPDIVAMYQDDGFDFSAEVAKPLIRAIIQQQLDQSARQMTDPSVPVGGPLVIDSYLFDGYTPISRSWLTTRKSIPGYARQTPSRPIILKMAPQNWDERQELFKDVVSRT
jgi:hypothetical protein